MVLHRASLSAPWPIKTPSPGAAGTDHSPELKRGLVRQLPTAGRVRCRGIRDGHIQHMTSCSGNANIALTLATVLNNTKRQHIPATHHARPADAHDAGKVHLHDTTDRARRRASSGRHRAGLRRCPAATPWHRSTTSLVALLTTRAAASREACLGTRVATVASHGRDFRWPGRRGADGLAGNPFRAQPARRHHQRCCGFHDGQDLMLLVKKAPGARSLVTTSRSRHGRVALSAAQLSMLLEGIDGADAHGSSPSTGCIGGTTMRSGRCQHE